MTSTYDPCLLYNDQAVVGLQTDDTLYLGTPTYIQREETELQNAGYPAKPIDKLTSKDLVFNGGNISRKDTHIELTQQRQCDKIKVIDTQTDFKAAYVRERARGAYIASTCQPEAVFSLSHVAQTTDLTKEDVDRLNLRLK
jgi:hypothetical protein